MSALEAQRSRTRVGNRRLLGAVRTAIGHSTGPTLQRSVTEQSTPNLVEGEALHVLSVITRRPVPPSLSSLHGSLAEKTNMLGISKHFHPVIPREQRRPQAV